MDVFLNALGTSLRGTWTLQVTDTWTAAEARNWGGLRAGGGDSQSWQGHVARVADDCFASMHAASEAVPSVCRSQIRSGRGVGRILVQLDFSAVGALFGGVENTDGNHLRGFIHWRKPMLFSSIGALQPSQRPPCGGMVNRPFDSGLADNMHLGSPQEPLLRTYQPANPFATGRSLPWGRA